MSTFQHMNFIVNYNRADYSTLRFTEHDRQVLRNLAGEVAELAVRPEMERKKALWYAHNALETTEPVLLCDPENGWNEIITDDVLLCTNSIARHWETYLRKLVFWGNEMGDDFVVEPYFDVPHIFRETPWRVGGNEHVQTDKAYDSGGGAYHIDTILDNYEEQFDRIIQPELLIDWDLSKKMLEIGQELFGDILTVRQKTWWFWSFGLTDEFAFLRGMGNLFMDLVDVPDQVHRLMDMLCSFFSRRFDYLEEHNLFSLNNDGTYVGSGGMGFCRELPGEGYDGTVRTKNLWGLSESQITVGVSPEMFAEFIFPYQKRLMERFGLTSYGCCEPLDDRIEIIRQVSNLRRVSVSPWAGKEIMAERLGRDYIFSSKPQPSYLATPVMDRDSAEKEAKDILRTARNSVLEMIMKDNHTLGNNPKNLTDWVAMIRRLMP